MNKIVAIAHINDNFQVSVEEGKPNTKVIAEIKAAGYILGAKSLAALRSGEKSEAGDFKALTQEQVDAASNAVVAPEEDKSVVTGKSAADNAKAALAAAAEPAKDQAAEPAVTTAEIILSGTDEQRDQMVEDAANRSEGFPFKSVEDNSATDEITADMAMGMTAEALKAKLGLETKHEDTSGQTEQAAPVVKPAGPVQLTPEQAALAAQVEGQLPTNEKKSMRGTDWSKVLPQTPQPVLKDSKQHKLFVRLCDPKGASKAELMDFLQVTAGGLAGIIHWDPKAKGYKLGSEKRDGVLYYHLCEIGTDRRYAPEEVVLRERAAAPAKKASNAAPVADSAQKSEPAAKVHVSKEQKAQVPHLGTASVTRRVAAKKA